MTIYKPSINTRSLLSFRYLDGASLFTIQCRQLELKKDITKINENSIYSIAVINFSFSAIEANINEFYKNIADNKSLLFIKDKIDEDKIKMLSTLYPHLNTRKTFDMYQTALSVSIDKKYTDTPKGKEFYDKANDLEKLRNALIHFQPEDSLNQYKHEKIEEMLKKYRIKKSVYYEQSQNPYFPDACLGYDLCRWSLKTSLDFIRYFYTRLGIKKLAKLYEQKIFLTQYPDGPGTKT